MLKVLKTIFLALLFILGITFSMENTAPVVLRYYGLETPALPLFLLVLFCTFLGVCLAGLGFLIDERLLRRSLREKERQVAALQSAARPYGEPGAADTRAEN